MNCIWISLTIEAILLFILLSAFAIEYKTLKYKVNSILIVSILIALVFFVTLYLLAVYTCNSRIKPIPDVIQCKKLKSILKDRIEESVKPSNCSKDIEINHASIEAFKTALISFIDDVKNITNETKNCEESFYILSEDKESEFTIHKVRKDFSIQKNNNIIEYYEIIAAKKINNAMDVNGMVYDYWEPKKLIKIKNDAFKEIIDSASIISYRVTQNYKDKDKAFSILKNCKSINKNLYNWYITPFVDNFEIYFQKAREAVLQKKSIKDQLVKELGGTIRELEEQLIGLKKQQDDLKNTKQQNPWKLEGFTSITLEDIGSFFLH